MLTKFFKLETLGLTFWTGGCIIPINTNFTYQNNFNPHSKIFLLYGNLPKYKHEKVLSLGTIYYIKYIIILYKQM